MGESVREACKSTAHRGSSDQPSYCNYWPSSAPERWGGSGGASRVWEHAIWRREDTLFMLVLHSSFALLSLPCGEREKEATFL